MNEEEFSKFVKRIYNAYGKKSPDPSGEVMAFLFEECGWIDKDSGKEVFNSLLSHNDKVPSKLHLSILSEYYTWSRSKGEPQKQITDKCPNNMPDEEGPCYNGEMFLYHMDVGEGRDACTFVCDDCLRSKYVKSNIPHGTLKDLMAKGWRIAQQQEDYPPPQWVLENIEMAKLGKSIKKEYPPPLNFYEIVEDWGRATQKARADYRDRNRNAEEAIPF